MTGALAKRYARALAEVAQEQGALEAALDELERALAWMGDPELAAALASPALDLDARRALLSQITATLELSELVRHFLELLLRNHRLALLPAAVRAYGRIVDAALGRTRARVRAAAELPEESVGEIRSAFERLHGKKVLLSVEVDPSLLGGVTVEIEGRVYDGSVRTQLAHLSRALVREEATG